MKRHNARILAMLTLYNIDVNYFNSSLYTDTSYIEQETKKMLDYLNNIVKEEDDIELDYEYSQKLVKMTLLNLTLIDELISKALVKYTIDRLSYVDRAIVRLSVYEMKYEALPKEVVINEALLMTREYSNLDDDAQVKFNNRLLENIAGKIYG